MRVLSNLKSARGRIEKEGIYYGGSVTGGATLSSARYVFDVATLTGVGSVRRPRSKLSGEAEARAARASRDAKCISELVSRKEW